MTRLYLTKNQAGNLVGFDAADAAYIAKIEPGEYIECDTIKARNPGHHKKFFALLQRAFVNQSRYNRIADLLIELKLRCSWYDEHVTRDGKLVYVPKSISWARLDQEGFDKFYSEAVIELAGMFPDVRDIVAEADEIIARRAA